MLGEATQWDCLLSNHLNWKDQKIKFHFGNCDPDFASTMSLVDLCKDGDLEGVKVPHQ